MKQKKIVTMFITMLVVFTGIASLWAQTEVPVVSTLNTRINVVFNALSGTFVRSISALAIIIVVILGFMQRINWMTVTKIVILTLIANGVAAIISFITGTTA